MITYASQNPENPKIDVTVTRTIIQPPPNIVSDTTIVALVLAGAALIFTGYWLYSKP